MSTCRQLWRGIWAMGLAAGLAPARAQPQPQGDQYWEAAGVPSWMIFPHLVYADTVHDALLIGGQQTIMVDGHQYNPLYRYRDGQWDTLGLFGNVIRTAVVYNDTLIVGGGFQTVHGMPIERIACYAGGFWQPYGVITDQQNAGDVSRLRIIDGELYALGTFDDADGVFCNGLAKRVGGHWEPVGTPLPTFIGDGSAWFFDAVRYQGELVVVGKFTSTDNTINRIMAYDGSDWHPVCQCMTGGFDGVASLAVYQGDLYLGGRYYFGPGNVGQGLMRWDGSQWYAVGAPGGGLQIYDHSDVYPPTVHDFAVRDGLLVVAGGFFFADHLPAAGVATWDGSEWCSLGSGPSPSNSYVSAMAFYHDTLYIGCGQFVVEGQEANGVARLIGNNYQVNCANTTDIAEVEGKPGLQVYSPSPGSIVLTGLRDGPHAMRVYDAEGRLVLAQEVRSTAGRTSEVEFDKHANALYFVRVDGLATAKFLPLE